MCFFKRLRIILIDEPASRVDMLRDSIRAHVAIALDEEKRDPAGREQRLMQAVDHLLVGAGAAHCRLPEHEIRRIFASDIELNSQGLQIWLARRAKQRG